MNINKTTLKRIRAYRTNHDPVIPHPQRRAWLESALDQLEGDILTCRYKRLENVPQDEPIATVTWPEMVAWCSTASMDAGMVSGELVGIFYHSLEQQIDSTWTDPPKNALPKSLSSETPITNRHQELAEKQRTSLKQAQDEIFIEELYDEIPFDTSDVPKAFWKQSSVHSSTPTSNDEESNSESKSGSEQMGLDMF